MEIELTPKQKKILKEGLKKGFIDLADFYMVYSSKEAAKNAVVRFLKAGVIRRDVGDRFILNKQYSQQKVL